MVHCSAHHQARQRLRNSTGGRDINIKKLLSTPKTMRALFQFIAETQRFHSTFGDIPTLTQEREERRGR
jgi:hypothetical protein